MSGLYIFPSGVIPTEPLNEQYQLDAPDTLDRSDFEQGPAAQINVSTGGVTPIRGVWPMTPVQKFIFDGILKNELANGAAWFQVPVFTNADYVDLRVRFVKGSIKFTRSGGEWMCAWSLETEDDVAPSATDTAAAILTFGSTDSLEDIVDLLHHIIHVDYPAACP